ncbi:double-strand break repair helicase AddA [Bradyrhizobium sp. LHD-71]|uniref:double-strand break repair helicase AddA n=1 Tax=Bradyrhizobium sp. LHD-71 TaxID=3072141 RepID=UPI00280DE212|nr:double-strand break repair helicase AddA [Bradyrhizobium sp. LHD-71]MDQ8731918.1 double-strand break repair helicase AddA [Bradyrhizobium sp. LHD-71]
MSAARKIPAAIRDTQARASDPEVSAFVSANAGAGKTHVLVQRVIRLLLRGTAPERILCITFTKAAAANMAQRVFETLGKWIALDDARLDAALRDAGVARPSATIRSDARKLFARALETPGGLKVQTIHALCTRLLQQFPFEANVPARFAVLDDRDQNAMMERASLAVLLDAAARPESAAGQALATAMSVAADVTFRDVVREACLSRDHFMSWIDRSGSAAATITELSRWLNVSPDDRLETVDQAIVDGPLLPSSQWSAAAAIFEAGTANDRRQAERLRGALATSDALRRERYLAVFLTADRERRKSLVTDRLSKSYPDFGARLDREADRLAELLDRRRAIAMRDRTAALVTIASAVAANYRREKNERGLLDYDDLIDKTLKMLEDTRAGWVHYKLDRGIDHVLIDEAQDTSPKQWQIVERLIADFTTGAGARDGIERTIFAVGDEKQSIFSFQGAAPHEFDERRRDFRAKFEAANLRFAPVSFNYSFRSGVSILQSVQSTFQAQAIYRSITSDRDGMPAHLAMEDAAPSVVDLWELQEPENRADIEGWRAPFDAVSETSPEAKLSERMARTIRRMIAGDEATGRAGGRRPLRAGDILVLVRRRGGLFDAVIQALKFAGVPVAGADRLKLTEHIAIIDLMNLADAILLPADDLALAVALKSPLFGLNEEQLFALAHGRKGRLREALAKGADDCRTFGDAFAFLQACEARAAHATPFAFFSWLLGCARGRAKIFQRLNHEPSDALDEFLELALTYEQREAASLQGFLAWLRAADTEIKRDMEISRDEVRVMTVHGAKGLEAPVVFLMDTTSSPTDTRRLNLVRLPQSAGGCVVWGGRKADDPPPVVAARLKMLEETEDEYRRLLYVAMTRAAERLIVGGIKQANRNEVRSGSWYDLIRTGLANSDLTEQVIETKDGPVRRYARAEDTLVPPDERTQAPAQAQLFLAPPWLRESVVATTPGFELRRPSDADDGDGHRFNRTETVADRQRALRRGVLVHRLLQSLPDIANDRRREAADRYLARNAGDDWPEAERAALAAETINLVDDPRFAALFAPGSRAEVPLIGRIERPGRSQLAVSGQIDRLIVADGEIWIADYKTNHSPPRETSGIPPAYRRQLALYRALLQRIYPARVVRAALVWTETPEIMEVPASVLDDEMTGIISP